jgi:hypothetical protein
MVETAIVALPMATPGATYDGAPSHLPAVIPAVDLTAIAPGADREQRVTTRAHGKSMVRHVLARADLLPGTSSLARLRRSTRPRAT